MVFGRHVTGIAFKKTFQLLNREEEKQGERSAGDSADYSDEGLAEQRQKDAQTRF